MDFVIGVLPHVESGYYKTELAASSRTNSDAYASSWVARAYPARFARWAAYRWMRCAG
jgi:hypothetical protein